jgi:hypothetical protein
VKVIHDYLHLKIIEALLNDLNAGALFPILILDIAYIGTTSQFALISLHSELSSTLLFLNCIMFLDSVMIQNAVYGEAGNVNHVSETILSVLKFSKFLRQDLVLRRKARAFTQLKVRVGKSGNFIEKLTPITMTLFSLEQAISLVLLSK